MKAQIQANYEERLSRYVILVQGMDPPGLVPKLAVYSELLRQQEIHGDRLWKIEPMLHPLMHSAEIDLHLATARLLEDPRRAEGSLFAFLNFCVINQNNITWNTGSPASGVFQAQLKLLESKRPTIDAIMGRRDKFFAHLDKRYFKDPSRIYADYPLHAKDVIALVNAVISVITDHQIALDDTAAISVGELYTVSIDNMVRNLEAGRRENYPGQLNGQHVLDPKPGI